MLVGCAGALPAGQDASLGPADLDGQALFRIACGGCHRVDASEMALVGPSLHGIAGRLAASRPGHAYSEALAASGLIWDRTTLSAWIAATENLVPGTTMSYANILTGDEVARVVDYLLEVGPMQERHDDGSFQDSGSRQ